VCGETLLNNLAQHSYFLRTGLAIFWFCGLQGCSWFYRGNGADPHPDAKEGQYLSEIPVVDIAPNPPPTNVPIVGPCWKHNTIPSAIFFEFDRSNITADQIENLQEYLKILREHPQAKIVIEGHSDERGTTEYNLVLGERRARAVADYLIRKGIRADRIQVSSKGEEEPFDPASDEAAWAKNRRAEFKFY
jgi:peptidoglycan-associated lipoprotein